jgi:hypothetical protein
MAMVVTYAYNGTKIGLCGKRRSKRRAYSVRKRTQVLSRSWVPGGREEDIRKVGVKAVGG